MERFSEFNFIFVSTFTRRRGFRRCYISLWYSIVYCTQGCFKCLQSVFQVIILIAKHWSINFLFGAFWTPKLNRNFFFCFCWIRKLLKANPCEHPIVILRDIRAEDVESLLRFMYNGEVHIGHEQLSDFLKTAQLLQVRGLADVTGPQSKGLPLSTSLIPESNTPSTAVDMNSLRSGMMGSLPNPLSVVNTAKLQETKASPVRKVCNAFNVIFLILLRMCYFFRSNFFPYIFFSDWFL